MLRGGMTWREFADISKSVFVQVASSDYGIGGRPTNVSRTSILTGLTRREVKHQREMLQGQLDESLTRVLARWHQDPDFSDERGNARELDYEHGEHSFTELLRRYAGDIPPKAMLKELVTTGAGTAVNQNLGRGADQPSRFISASVANNVVVMRARARDPGQNSFVLLGVTAATDAATAFEDNNQAIDAATFYTGADGSTVEVEGMLNGRIIDAERVSILID